MYLLITAVLNQFRVFTFFLFINPLFHLCDSMIVEKKFFLQCLIYRLSFLFVSVFSVYVYSS